MNTLHRDDWEIVSLSDVGQLTMGQSPRGASYNNLGQGLPLLNGAVELRPHSIRISKFTTEPVRIAEKGDLLFCIRATIGNLNEADQQYCLGRGVAGLRVREGYSKNLVGFYLESLFGKMRNLSQGGVIKGLKKEEVGSFQFSIPKDIAAQNRVADVLTAATNSIKFTQEIIDQSELLKKGLMQRLFTEGINHNGFKKTSIGKIPESWQVVRLDEVARRGSGHTPDKKKPEYYNGGIKWISLGDTNKFDRGLISDTKIQISQRGIDNSSAVLHESGTVVLSRDAGVGKSAILDGPMAVSQHFMTWKCSDKLYNWFLYYYLQSMKSEFERVAIGSTIKTIGLPYFKAMEIPLPGFEEQREIASILLAVDEKISVGKRFKAEQQELKKGLMQDLLAGKVRV